MNVKVCITKFAIIQFDLSLEIFENLLDLTRLRMCSMHIDVSPPLFLFLSKCNSTEIEFWRKPVCFHEFIMVHLCWDLHDRGLDICLTIDPFCRERSIDLRRQNNDHQLFFHFTRFCGVRMSARFYPSRSFWLGFFASEKIRLTGHRRKFCLQVMRNKTLFFRNATEIEINQVNWKV